MIQTLSHSIHLTTAEQVAYAVRQEIINGKLAAGAPIRQEELAAAHSVSRMPVREALRLLEAEGLVTIYPGRGTFVNRPTPQDIREIYEIRILLECDAIGRAIPNLSRGALGTAEDIYDAMSTATDGTTFGQLDVQFHTTLYTPSQRPRLLQLITTLRNQVTQALYSTAPLNTFGPIAQPEHRAILDACHAGDADTAVAAVRTHLTSSANYVSNIWQT